jgi:hypothetical protein
MGKAGEIPAKRTNSSRKGKTSRNRRTRRDPTNRTNQTPNIQISKSMDQTETDTSLWLPTTLGEPDSPIKTTGSRFLRLRLKAETALEQLVDNADIPANVRASAARTLLELVGAIGPKAKGEADQALSDGDLEPEAMSLADIDRELQRLS